MKKIAFYACILSSSFLLAQEKPKGKEWKVPEASAKMKSTVKYDDAAIKSGKDIWLQNCKSCHGTKGLGDGAKAEKIEISCGDFSSNEIQRLSDGALFYKTTEGRKPMPSFKDNLSDIERWQVVQYIRTMKKAGSVASDQTAGINTSTNKSVKEPITKKQEDAATRKDSIVGGTATKVVNENKGNADTLKTSGMDYKYLKEEIEILKQDVKSLKLEVEALKNAKPSK